MQQIYGTSDQFMARRLALECAQLDVTDLAKSSRY